MSSHRVPPTGLLDGAIEHAPSLKRESEYRIPAEDAARAPHTEAQSPGLGSIARFRRSPLPTALHEVTRGLPAPPCVLRRDRPAAVTSCHPRNWIPHVGARHRRRCIDLVLRCDFDGAWHRPGRSQRARGWHARQTRPYAPGGGGGDFQLSTFNIQLSAIWLSFSRVVYTSCGKGVRWPTPNISRN